MNKAQQIEADAMLSHALQEQEKVMFQNRVRQEQKEHDRKIQAAKKAELAKEVVNQRQHNIRKE